MNGHYKVRYWLVTLFFSVSIIPYLISVPILGIINLFLLVIIWVILFISITFCSKQIATCVAVFGALVMAIPPVPNYLFFEGSGKIYFQFIGLENIINEIYGVVSLFIVYVILFELTVLLIQKEVTPKK